MLLVNGRVEALKDLKYFGHLMSAMKILSFTNGAVLDYTRWAVPNAYIARYKEANSLADVSMTALWQS